MPVYESIEVAAVTPEIGAVVSGVDLRDPLEDTVADEVRVALSEHLVLFFRDQKLTDEEHLRFASVFGAPNVFPATRARGLDQPLEWIEDTPKSPPKADLWHTDVAYLPEPPDVAVLAMQESPPVGGDTLWLSLYEAFDKLSVPLQQLLLGLQQELHPGQDMKAKLELQFGSGIYEQVEAEFSGAVHPLVRRHPQTGRPALYMCGSYVTGVVDLSTDESDMLLGFLRSRLDDPGSQCRWKWRQHDIAVWDERCTNHRALGDHFPAHRLVRRCTVGADVPYGM
jgi:taurine dioxygenase